MSKGSKLILVDLQMPINLLSNTRPGTKPFYILKTETFRMQLQNLSIISRKNQNIM